MSTQLQIKRTTVTGRTPNTTNSGNSTYIAAGELAINLTDGKLFSSNGTALITVGSNVSSLNVTGSFNLPNTVTVSGTSGTNGQYLGIVGANLAYASLPPTIAIYDEANTLLSNAYFITGSSLNQLSDVDTATTAPANNNLLMWSNVVSNWVPSGNVSLSSLSVTYMPATTTGYALTLSAANSQGGTGYADFLKATNGSTGVTNPNKSFRLNSTGGIEIINSAYTADILTLTDAGNFSVSGSISVGGKKAVNGPAFRAYVAIGQTIASGSQIKVTFGTENFDTDGCFASSTFTPSVEGYYQLNATVRISGTASTGEIMLVLYKNGSEYARGTNESGTEQGSSFYSMQISDIAYANGTTDNFDIRIQQTSGGDRATTAGSTISHFSGCMIRGA